MELLDVRSAGVADVGDEGSLKNAFRAERVLMAARNGQQIHERINI